jgi:hypothetical protein
MPVNQMPIKIKNLKYFEPKVSKVPITQQPTKWALPHQIPTKKISKNQSSSLFMSEGRLNGQRQLQQSQSTSIEDRRQIYGNSDVLLNTKSVRQ